LDRIGREAFGGTSRSLSQMKEHYYPKEFLS